MNVFLFLVTTAKLLGEFYNYRRSIVHVLPILSFPLCCANTIGHCDLYSARTKRGEYEKSTKILSLALRKRPASPKGAASAHHFAYKRRAQRSANNIAGFFYSANSIAASPIIPELAYKFGSTTSNGKSYKQDGG
jgi:hypothetical protein